jgi:hypothetical protein
MNLIIFTLNLSEIYEMIIRRLISDDLIYNGDIILLYNSDYNQ